MKRKRFLNACDFCGCVSDASRFLIHNESGKVAICEECAEDVLDLLDDLKQAEPEQLVAVQVH